MGDLSFLVKQGLLIEMKQNSWDSRYYCAGYGYIDRNDKSNRPSRRRIKLPKFLLCISPILFLVILPITNGTVSGILSEIFTKKLIPEKDKDKSQKAVLEKPNPDPIDKNKNMGGPDDDVIYQLLKEYYQKEAYKHNKNAKLLLDQAASTSEKSNNELINNAISELYVSLSIDKELPETYYLLGSAYVKLGEHYSYVNNIPKAIEAYNESLKNFQSAEDKIYEPRANIFFERGKAFNALGSIYQNIDSDLSEDYFFRALDEYVFCIVNSYTSQNAHFEIAEIYFKMGNYKEAIKYYTDALKVINRPRPTENEIFIMRSNAYYMLGMRYFLFQDYSNAIQSYKKSINDNHKNYYAHYELGKTYTFEKMWLESIEQFDFVIERCPDKIYQGLAREGRNIAMVYIQ